MSEPQPQPSSPPPLYARRFGIFVPDVRLLRQDLPLWQQVLLGLACIGLVLLLWWAATREENPLISPLVLPSPQRTFASFLALWEDRDLFGNLVVSLQRVALGFLLATVIGVPLGILCGCFPRVLAFFMPLSLFGRNIPIAALIPLTFSLFGTGEAQKIIFIFIACVAFVVHDTATAVQEVGSQYIDTAYTLGANTWQVIIKVLVPLAMPSVFNSLRLLFGLAFGYIMLAEVIKFGEENGGLGDLIDRSQRLGKPEHIILIILIIPAVALAIDQFLFWVQRELFPHRYGGVGHFALALGWVGQRWEDAKGMLWQPPPVPGQFQQPPTQPAKKDKK